jgi:hypothetical protein
MTDTISNTDDVIDSRDVIARIDELTAEIEGAYDEARGDVEEYPPIVEWMERADNPLQDEIAELEKLKALATEAEGYAADWHHGETLIRDSYFEEYAQELAEDCGMIERDVKWPYTCIDWEQAARELQMDYTSVDFDGVTYWVR